MMVLTPNLLSIIAHDLRNGLNSIHMSIHIVGSELPEENAILVEDFQLLKESVLNMKTMLDQLASYAEFVGGSEEPSPIPFTPREAIETVLLGLKPEDAERIHVEYESGLPEVVELDQRLAEEALRLAFLNALQVAGKDAVTVTVSGDGDHWVTSIRDPSALANAEASSMLTADSVQRILSGPRDRHGFDLGIVALASQRLGGTAKLFSRDGNGSELVLDWPTSRKTIRRP